VIPHGWSNLSGIVLSESSVWHLQDILDDSEYAPFAEWLYHGLFSGLVGSSVDEMYTYTAVNTQPEELAEIMEDENILSVISTISTRFVASRSLPWTTTEFALYGQVTVRLPGSLLLECELQQAHTRF